MAIQPLKGLIIRPSFAYQTAPDDNFLSAVNGVEKGMEGNAVLNAPPVPISSLKAERDDLIAAIAAAKDGGKQAVVAKNKKRSDVALMMRLLAHYVEIACKGDMGVFLSSGFQAIGPPSPKPAQPVGKPTVEVEQGQTGTLLLVIKKVATATHYDAQDTIINPGTGGTAPGTPGTWTSQLVNDVKQPVPFNNLTPGTVYAFRVRAYGKLGYGDFSNIVQRMCI